MRQRRSRSYSVTQRHTRARRSSRDRRSAASSRGTSAGARGEGGGERHHALAVRHLLLGSPPSRASTQTSVAGTSGCQATSRGPGRHALARDLVGDRQVGDRRHRLPRRVPHLDRAREVEVRGPASRRAASPGATRRYRPSGEGSTSVKRPGAPSGVPSRTRRPRPRAAPARSARRGLVVRRAEQVLEGRHLRGLACRLLDERSHRHGGRLRRSRRGRPGPRGRGASRPPSRRWRGPRTSLSRTPGTGGPRPSPSRPPRARRRPRGRGRRRSADRRARRRAGRRGRRRGGPRARRGRRSRAAPAAP